MFALHQGDCMALFPQIPDASVDLIVCDLPYGTTYAKWDSVIPFDALWAAYGRVIKPNGAIVLTASQPFTSALVMSKPEWFRCEWIWDKVNAANFANANRQPLKSHESVLVFAKNAPRYFPIKVPGKPNHVQGKNAKANISETRLINERVGDDLSGMKYPKSIQTFAKHSSQGGLHPTQKPVDLIEYFVKTYSQDGETVLDNCMGSGTTGVACANTNRRFIGMEMEERYFQIASERIAKAYADASPVAANDDLIVLPRR